MYDPKAPVENMPNKYGYLFFQERSMYVQVQYVGGGGVSQAHKEAKIFNIPKPRSSVN